MAREAKNVVKANDQAIARVARTEVAKQSEWKVEGVPGLSLVVTPGGAATFYVRYHVGRKPNVKWKRTALGRYAQGGHGGLSLADARSKALELAREIELGGDPIQQEAERAKALTLRALFAARLERDAETHARTMDDYRQALERDVFPELGNQLADAITPDQFATLLERIEDRAKHAAHKVRSGLGSTYRWAQRRRLVKVNPIAGLAFTHQSQRRKRVLSDAELKALWQAIDAANNVEPPTKAIIKLAVLTGQRNSECAGMELAELKGLDSATPRWDIPAERMKRKSDNQHVPLPPQAVAVIKAALPNSDGKYVFPGTTHGRQKGAWRQEHIGQETVSRAFSRIAKLAKLTDARLHDMRKCVTSWLAEHGHATPEVLDAILHHGRKGVTGSHYNFALYEGQVRKALGLWADHIVHLASTAATDRSNVVAMPARAS